MFVFNPVQLTSTGNQYLLIQRHNSDSFMHYKCLPCGKHQASFWVSERGKIPTIMQLRAQQSVMLKIQFSLHNTTPVIRLAMHMHDSHTRSKCWKGKQQTSRFPGECSDLSSQKKTPQRREPNPRGNSVEAPRKAEPVTLL